ncbi:conjugal transfer protein TraG [Gluconacetobacter azotocaptans]|uniref:Conjugal transfer protein TraG n=1 Tax=Gluconacetobacter azotocaptans TaxID=142834 RepID=A0A7W4PEN9_9PROT|nr:conjugal transfer protein TraG [Gluconacetobacter azotocaptans]MBB2190755.1 conjugal transfer protein TraG [Gluconacetobacter azotocaptans]GBQ30681.1 conjugal transfer protein TraG [Gluconacetobacter azotocaptans DSM 13594]
MTGSRILWGQMLGALFAVLAGLWGATEWTAWRLSFAPALGRPWLQVQGLPVYPPHAFFPWWLHFDRYAPRVFAIGAMIATFGGIGAMLIALLGSLLRARQAAIVTTYGSARWAVRDDLRHSGLFEPAGVPIGRDGREILRHEGPEHVLVFAPTRSGKGVGLVVPTLLSWCDSVIVHDIKGENWTLTAGWRAQFSHALLFDPTDPRSAAYNPLLEVRRGIWEVRDVQNIADVLVDPEGALERRNHWEKTSHALLVGAILHVLYAEPDKTLAGVATFLSDPSRAIESTLRIMMTTQHRGAQGVHPVVAQAARELLNKSDNERSGVLSTAMSFLGLYRDPVVAGVTSRCDWRIADLVEAERPVSLYLVVPPSDISRTKPLIRLVLNQIGRRLTEKLDNSARRHRLLMMLDEFPALGRLDFFESALAFQAGYGIRAFLIAQSLNQIQKAYGEHDAILDNCHVRICFATNDERTARRISDALGTATELRNMKNYAGHRLAPWLPHLMVSRQETPRPLLTPGEVMQLPASDEIVMIAGLPPIRARKLRYYDDRAFAGRVLSPPVLSAQGYADRPPGQGDDWTGLAPVAAPADRATDPAAPAPGGNGGLRQEPELPAHEESVPAPAPANEFAFVEDEPDDDAQRARFARQTTRTAAMDRDDGLGMEMTP